MLRVAIALAVALTTIPVYAQVFKCTDSSGNIEYRDAPCPADTAGTAMDSSAQAASGHRADADTPKEARPARKHKRPETVAVYSFRGPRSIPPPLPVAALPPPPPK